MRICRDAGRLPTEVERGTRFLFDVEMPRWLRWLGPLLPQVTVYQDLGIEPEDIREQELLAEIEADEERARLPVQEVGPDGF